MKPLTDATVIAHINKYAESPEIVTQAYDVHILWQRMHSKTSCKTLQSFIVSRAFMSFVNYALYAKRMHIFSDRLYLCAMKKNKRHVSQWCTSYSYTKYCAFMYNQLNPVEAMNETCGLLKALSGEKSCTPREYIQAMDMHILLKHIRQFKITPWILFHSSTFRNRLLELPEGARETLFELVNPHDWRLKFYRDPKNTTEAVNRVKMLDI